MLYRIMVAVAAMCGIVFFSDCLVIITVTGYRTIRQTIRSGAIKHGNMVEVVRCKDCKYYHENGGYKDVPFCEYTGFEHDPEYYCSNGRSREDAQ